MAGGTAVLEDPTGRRGRRLRLLSRLIAGVLTLWLVGLLLGGVGIAPVAGIPFGSLLRPPSAPPAATNLPHPIPPTVEDLQPALPAGATATAQARSALPSPANVNGQAPSSTRGSTRTGSHSPHSVAVHTMTPAAGGNATPGTPPANAQVNNGQGKGPVKKTSTTTTTTTTTTPGRSGAAPGKTGTTPSTSNGKSHRTTTTP